MPQVSASWFIDHLLVCKFSDAVLNPLEFLILNFPTQWGKATAFGLILAALVQLVLCLDPPAQLDDPIGGSQPTTRPHRASKVVMLRTIYTSVEYGHASHCGTGLVGTLTITRIEL
ncbi:uncharacterized protein FIBRA_06229 [Fibroporia radiculosa]|uniref:Uncharacterized protein n=1 Tax=Fibroporia radiculosa TaxID=599839 RepID=J4GSD6_9APHY|nr:uncharacterized protein FIBRA_06229 [Fibroporia radiculosa]CCM04070.1 predicted protein [Fibroporia radiculosa]